MRVRPLASLAIAVLTMGFASASCSSKSKSSGTDGSASASERERSSPLQRASRQVVRGLSYPVSLKVYATKGVPEVDALVTAVKPMLDAYVEASRRDEGRGEPWLSVEFIDASQPDGNRAAVDAGLREENVSSTSTTRAILGFTINAKSSVETIPFWPTDDAQALEFFLTKKLRAARARADETKLPVGIVTGKEELALTDATLAPAKGGYPSSLLALHEQLFPTYELVGIDLEGGAAGVDPRLSGLLVTQPAVDYTEAELRQIDAFLMRGGKSLAIFAGAVNLKPYNPSLQATLSTHGLEKLLARYGVELKTDAVFDPEAAWGLPIGDASSKVTALPITWALVLGGEHEPPTSFIDGTYAPFFRLRSLPFPFASTLVLHPKQQPSATLRARARTSPRAYAVTTPNVDMSLSTMLSLDAPPASSVGERIVAVSVEGTIASAFEDGRTAPNSRVFVVSSSEFLANPFARAGNPPPTPPQLQMMGESRGDQDMQIVAGQYFKDAVPPLLLAFENTVEWLASDPDMADLERDLPPAPTSPKRATHAN